MWRARHLKKPSLLEVYPGPARGGRGPGGPGNVEGEAPEEAIVIGGGASRTRKSKFGKKGTSYPLTLLTVSGFKG